MCEYLTHLVHFGTDESVFGDRFRASVQALDAKGSERTLPRGLFHYEADGRPKPTVPGIRFGGGRGVGRIVALGDEAVDLLGGCGHRITRLFGEERGRPLRDSRYSGTVSASRDGRMYGYRIPRLFFLRPVNGKSARADRALAARFVAREAVAEPTIAALLEKRIRAGIEAQADAYGIDVPEDFLLGDLRFDGVKPLPYKNGSYGQAAAGVVFRTDVKLDGPWHVGYLRARGYGEVRRFPQP